MRFLKLLKWDTVHLLRTTWWVFLVALATLVYSLVPKGESSLIGWQMSAVDTVYMVAMVCCLFLLMRILLIFVVDLQSRAATLEKTVQAPYWMPVLSKVTILVVGNYLAMWLVNVMSNASLTARRYEMGQSLGEIARKTLFEVDIWEGAVITLFFGFTISCALLVAGSVPFMRRMRLVWAGGMTVVFIIAWVLVTSPLFRLVAFTGKGDLVQYMVCLFPCIIFLGLMCWLYADKYDARV